MFMDPVARVFTTIPLRAGFFITIMSIRVLALPMGRSSSVGTKLLGIMDGPLCEKFLRNRSSMSP